MTWTPKQQGIYRRLVTAAWKKHAGGNGIAEKDKPAKERWYRKQLHAELGVWTTKELSQNDFAKACATFEAIIGESIYWATRALGGKESERKRRALHAIREQCRKADIEEDYARGIARQALKRDTLPWLDDLTADELITLMQLIKYNARQMQPEHDAAEPTEAELAAAGVTKDEPW
jgi:hypothetical protein